ncbi:MAG: ABC transporter permease [Solobacterium sp.]|jgi:spermidine/putrescine transport system permease protein|nr:ABC transporter permease [Solobacterium sp.]MCH4048164.1 ABC transporter permease [Solobacterium sp.]MCH4074982.1 ABC transporter permease [Solobacterium sp.]MCI1313606.1 ABC transporter permease [Solobacterium sp.]MCI1345810.1 ABC transporter permease [Solobacterium sp.]
MKKVWHRIWLVLIMAFFYLPIIYVVFFSFNRSKSLTRFTGFSWRWYENMFSSRPILDAIWYTVLCAVLATAISTIVGTVTSIALSKNRKVIKEFVRQVNNLPMLNPEIVTAIGFMLFYSSLHIKTGFVTMLLAHIAFCTPYVMLTIMPRLRRLDPNMAEAAMDLGCTPWQVIWKVIVPQIRNSIGAAALIAFSMSFDDFVISMFTTGPGVQNISIYVYGNVKRVNPTINALSSIIVLVVTVVLILTNIVPYIRDKRRKKNEAVLEDAVR